MANYSVLKAAVQAVVKTNGNQEITGANMQSTLISIINSLGTGYQFMGVATPSTSPGTPDYNVAYIGGAGTYANFGTSVTVPVGSIGVFKYNGSWAKEQIALFAGIDDAPTASSNNLVKSGGVFDDISGITVELGLPSFRNGSFGNAGNANLITTQFVRTNGTQYIGIEINRPNTEGCHYVIGYGITSDAQWEGSLSTKTQITDVLADITADYGEDINPHFLDISQYPTAACICLQIGEKDSTDTYHPLRITDFEKKSIRIYASSTEDEMARLACSKLFNELSVFQPVWVLGSLTVTTSGWGWGISKQRVRLMRGQSLHLYVGDTIGLTDYTNAEYTFGWKTADGTYKKDVVSWRTSDCRIAEEGDYVFSLRHITEVDLSSPSELSNLFILPTSFRKRLETIEYSTNNIANTVVVGQSISIVNGSVGNAANPNNVSSQYIINVSSTNKITFITSRPNLTGYKYKYTWDTYNVSSGLSRPKDTRVIREIALRENPTLDLQSGEVGVAVTIFEVDAITGVERSLRASDFEGYNAGLLFNYGLYYDLSQNINWQTNASLRYLNKTSALSSACRLHQTSTTQKDLQFVILTDIHADTLAANNAAKVTTAFSTVDALMCLGDINAGAYGEAFQSTFADIMQSMNKPFYVCLGNHDVGNSKYIGHCATSHQQEYDAFIKPVVDSGYLASGEYTDGLSYYYHDFTSQNIRLIVLNEYDEPLGVDSFNETYWQAVEYDGTLSNVSTSTSYSVGAKVNVSGYTGYSFQCVQSVTTPSSYYTTPEKFPSYKIRRGERVIMQTQAQWFLNTLANTPANYGVVVALHNPFSSIVTNQQSFKFSQDTSSWGSAQNLMATDFIANAVNAFVNGSNYSENVAMMGDAAYLNTQGGGTYAYTVSKNFSTKNTGVKFLCFLGGHVHKDVIIKHNNYQQYQVLSICATTNIANNYGNDIKRIGGDGFGEDSINVISFDNSQIIRLVKIGDDVTTDMYLRDIEKINLVSN